jgi:hypothetical protein
MNEGNKPDPNEPKSEEFDVNSLAESLLNGAKEEEKKLDDKDKSEEVEKPVVDAEEKPADSEKPMKSPKISRPMVQKTLKKNQVIMPRRINL